ncbi:CoA transferase [Mesorhizobium sp. M0088]|uniref:CaiB/BaiF CoA transferase family protein n=1 Tax=Mesorhizobium sp. M0088 TaxID=2956873 RepID=UPI0033379F9C
MAAKTSDGPLGGLKVLDLSRFIAGPYCAMVLGDLGADVAKIERVQGGDDVRALSPKIKGESVYFFVFNRNKRSLTLDFRDPESQRLLRQLIGQADVLIENFRPGTMEKMGLGWDAVREINPRIVMARISGFGQTGVRAGEPCFDAIAQALSGLMSLTGEADGPPTIAGTFVVDYATALYSAIGILAAIEERHRTKLGKLVDVSLVGTGISLLVTAIAERGVLGRIMSRVGNRDRYSAPAQVFKTKDGEWLYLIAGNDVHFPRLVRAMGRQDLLGDPRFSTLQARMANVDAIELIVGAYVAEAKSEDLLRDMRAAEVPCAKVADLDALLDDPYVQEAGHIVTMEHKVMGRVPVQANPIKLDGQRLQMRMAAPLLGEHSSDIVADWIG